MNLKLQKIRVSLDEIKRSVQVGNSDIIFSWIWWGVVLVVMSQVDYT